MKRKKEQANDAMVNLFILVDDEETRRKVFELLSNLEDEYRAEMAMELRHFLLTGRDSIWHRSRLMLRFYCIAKRLMGFTDAYGFRFNLKLYHELG